MRQSLSAPPGVLQSLRMTGGETIPIGMRYMTIALFGLAIYLFCVHSFKLPIASVGIGIGLFGVLLSGERVTVPLPALFLAGFVAWASIGLFTTAYPSQVNTAVVDIAKLMIIFFVALNATRTAPQLTLLIGLWVLLFGLYPARGTYFNYFFGYATQGRYGWNFSFRNPNDLAALTILVVGLSGFLALGRYPRWVRLLALASAAGNSLIVIITQSRGALVGVVIAVTFLLLRSRNRIRLLRFVVVAAVGITLYAPASVWERFSRMKFLQSTETLDEADSSAAQRYILFQIARTVASEHLLTGIGFGAYPQAHAAYAEERVEWQGGRGERDAHSLYLSILAETGIPGFLLYLAFLGSVLLEAIKAENRLRKVDPLAAEQLRVLRFALIAYLIDSVFGSFHKTSFLYLYVAVLWSAAQILSRTQAGIGMNNAVPLPPSTGLRETGIGRALPGPRRGMRVRA